MAGRKACSFWRSVRRLRRCGEGRKCAKRRWRQAHQDRQDSKGGGVAGARRRYPRGALNTSSSHVTRDALELLIRVGQGVIGSALQSPGLSLLTKLIFFGVIVGVVLSLLRNRKPPVEKSLA